MSHVVSTKHSVFCGDMETIVGLIGIVLCCGHCSVSFQSSVLRHLVIAPFNNTKKSPNHLNQTILKKAQKRLNCSDFVTSASRVTDA